MPKKKKKGYISETDRFSLVPRQLDSSLPNLGFSGSRNNHSSEPKSKVTPQLIRPSLWSMITFSQIGYVFVSRITQKLLKGFPRNLMEDEPRIHIDLLRIYSPAFFNVARFLFISMDHDERNEAYLGGWCL